MRSPKFNNFATAVIVSIIRSRPRRSANNFKPPKTWRTVALLYGDEWPQVKVKTLATREEKLVPNEELLAHLQAHLSLSS